MKHIPLGDRIVVEPIDGETKRASGFIMASHSKTHTVGNVVAVGEGLFTQTGDKIPMTVKVGDQVAFSTGTGTDITLDETEYKMFRESDLLLILKEENVVVIDEIKQIVKETAEETLANNPTD